MNINIKESVNVIGQCMKDDNNSFFLQNKKNQRLDFKKSNHVAYLENGCITMHRIDDGLLTITIRAPAIIGLGQFRGESFTHYIRCTTECGMWVMTAEDTFKLLSRFDLWQHAFDILTKHLYMYFTRDNMMQKSTVRDIVIDHIKMICSFEESIRTSTSIYTYILSRNAISRSAVHKVVQELVKDGSLVLNRGKIISFREE
ncbi:hypothetical protein B6J58_26560 [Klebsiella quasipneumoniae]|nr:transcriptional regulator [Klebsiella sp. HSTU-Sny5]OCU25612.1 hypothetical protein A6D87_10545 [Klebsiella quasipneumoniae]OVY26921.1 hypothetical protein BME69_25835 [Klebsiella quasipneumoniae subsp. quasipneumoniae]HBW8871289.1 transcriptional regulator [Klebsiella quasipneumoniae subsp. similipneumoniae]PLJ01663.1 hypothetical protein B6J58_26560 [Klebsiella quasipneumoniae]